MTNLLCYGDNLTMLRDSIRDESVDLIFLDPPFNLNASYNVLFKGPAGAESAAQIEAFDDTWHWNDSAEAAFGAAVDRDRRHPFSRGSDRKAAARGVQGHRVQDPRRPAGP